MRGKVYLVGVGPGDPKLLTLRAVEIIKKADVIFFDKIVSKKILSTIPQKVKKVCVGQAGDNGAAHPDSIYDLMFEYAKKEKSVIHLTGGDPLIFGIGGEEAEFLKQHKIQYEIIPGITAGIGCANYVGIPLTHRKFSSSIVFAKGQTDQEKFSDGGKWKRLAKSVDTIVISMGLSSIEGICKQLILGGMEKSTPVAVIQNGTTPQQKMITGTVLNIARLIKKNKFKTPSIIIVGKVVDLSRTIGWKSYD